MPLSFQHPEDMTTLPAIYVEWIDADYEYESETFADSPDLPVCRTIGFLVKETDDSVVVIQDRFDDKGRAVTRIPKRMIERLRRFEIDHHNGAEIYIE